MIIHVAIIILAVGGFIISSYIYRVKAAHKEMVCVIGKGKDCNRVINSKYGKTLGVPNEVAGMAYYFFIGLVYLTSLFYDASAARYLSEIVVLAAAASALFSVYLIIVQAFILREFCEWCLSSASISIFIFFLIVI